MKARDKLVEVAAKEVGVKESPAGSNKVKYNTWYYGREVSGSSYPWCAVFVCWCFKQAGVYDLIRHTAGCTTMMNWFKDKGRIVPTKQAEPGDVVFYQFDGDSYADHVGIVEKVTATGVVAIEGNTSVTSNDNGGAVMRRSRSWSLIMAVARPDWEKATSPEPVKSGIEKEEVEMTEKEVRELVVNTVAEATRPKVYNTVEECPAWSRQAVAWAVERGFIQGDGTGKLGLDNHKVWAIQVTYNVMERGRT